MKKIKDERLLIKNLKNIRIAFLVQRVGLYATLTYKSVTEGPREANDFIRKTIVLLYEA